MTQRTLEEHLRQEITFICMPCDVIYTKYGKQKYVKVCSEETKKERFAIDLFANYFT
jgi:hypothetical protein